MTKHRWNPSIHTVKKGMYYRNKVIKTKKKREGTYKGTKATIVNQEAIGTMVDTREYVKLYTSNEKLFDLFVNKLNKSGIQMLHYIIFHRVIVDMEFIHFSSEECMQKTGWSYDVVRRGIRNLVNNGVLIDSVYENRYWINVEILYKGSVEDKVKEYIDLHK